METEQKVKMKSRVHTCQNHGVGLHLSKNDYSKRVLIHQHMMSHYRRLYNVKCNVDTSAPSHFKPRYKPQPRPLVSSLPIQNQLTVNDLKFLESLASDMRIWCGRNESRQCLMHCEENDFLENMTNRCTTTRLENCKNCGDHEYQIVARGAHSLSTTNVLPKPKSMKNESKMEMKKSPLNFSVPSKLREMSVYHPPRKRLMEKSSCKHCSWCPPMNIHHGNDVNKYVSLKNNEEKCDLNAEKVSAVMEIQKEKLQYLQFVQDITQDILNNEMFSNDDLEEICRNHVELNRGKLDMDKMMEQIQILKKQLGIEESSAYRVPHIINIPRCETKSHESSSYEESKLRFCPFVQVHKSKELVSDANFKRNFECRQQSIVNKPQTCKYDESNIFNLLKSIGFDSEIIEEVCIEINDQDNMRSSHSKLDVPDFSGPYEIGEFSGKKDGTYQESRYCPCTLQKTSKVRDQNFINVDKSEKTLRKPDNVKQKESKKRYQSPNDMKGKKNPVMKVEKAVTQKKKEICENSKLPFSNSDKVYEKSGEPKTKTSFLARVVSNEDLKESSTNHNYQGGNKENSSSPVNAVSSPVASDYSSMKDHEESVSEVYSVGEVSDEGRESASEVEEDIPDDISQTSTSSRISQLTEQFKSISVNTGSELHTYNANVNLRSKENKSSFQPLST